jgi:transcription-repair coupling factor (superfamily II helicase)
MMMIGYELYYKLVEDAVRELSACDKLPGPAADVSVEIDVEAYISNAFIQDELIKLQMYKKIASIRSRADRQEVIDELLDRFGEIPKETLNLIDIADIKAMAEKAGITRIRQEKNKLVLDFDSVKGLDPERVSKLVDHYGLKLLIHGGQRPFIKLILQKKDILTETIVLLTKLT